MQSKQANSPFRCRLPAVFSVTALLLVLLISCQRKQASFLSAQEQDWLDQRHGKLEILFGYESPPNAYYNDKNEYVGLLVDYLHELEAHLNFSFTLHNFKTWKELMAHSMTGSNFIIVGIAPSKSRSAYLSFTDTFIKVPYVVVTRHSSKAKGLEDFSGKNICTVAGYAVNDYIAGKFPEVSLQEVNDNTDGLRGVSTGSCEAMVINQMYASHIIEQQGISNLKIAGESGYLNHLAAAVSISDKELFNILQKTVNQIEPKRHRELYSRWVTSASNRMPKTILYIAIICVSMALGIMILLWLWSISLRKEVLKQTKKLRAGRKQFRTVIAKGPIPMFLADHDQKITLFNDRFTNQFGYSTDNTTTVDELWQKAFPDQDHKEIANYFGSNDDIQLFETDLKAENSTLHRIELTVTPLETVSLYTMNDITKRYKAVEEREKLQTQLIQAQKIESIGQLAGGIAHDFNNMLGVILGHAELALLQLDVSNTTYHNVSEIHTAATHSADITRKLLAFARQQTVLPKVLDVNRTISGMISMVQRLLGEDITLQFQEGHGIWPLKLDPTQLDQIIINLCVNARAAIENIGTITIETTNRNVDQDFLDRKGEDLQAGEFVQINVSDTGCGMDEKTLIHIFEPFFTTKAIGEGTGLGLSTVYGAVKQNRGFITVYSELDSGTTFSIFFPRHLGEPAKQVDNPATSGELQGGDETILLVEDEKLLLEMTGAILEELGYTVIAANNPQDALQLFIRHDQIDILVTDVIMPDMNGRELAEHIMYKRPDMKCIFTSGYTANIIAVQGLIEEGFHFIQKPYSQRDLADKVRAVLDS